MECSIKPWHKTRWWANQRGNKPGNNSKHWDPHFVLLGFESCFLYRRISAFHGLKHQIFHYIQLTRKRTRDCLKWNGRQFGAVVTADKWDSNPQHGQGCVLMGTCRDVITRNDRELVTRKSWFLDVCCVQAEVRKRGLSLGVNFTETRCAKELRSLKS